MKISQLVTIENTKLYHESVASRLPRGLTSQKRLLNLGFDIAVRDLGLSKATTLDENFAINLVNSYHKQCIDEGIGTFLGKSAGHAVGATGAALGAAARGIKGAWQDAKAGYKSARASWKPNAGGTAATGTPGAAMAQPATSAAATSGTPDTTSAPATGTPGAAAAQPATSAAATSGSDISSIMQAIDKLDLPTKRKVASELEKSIAAAVAQGKTTYDPAKAAADKLAKGQADQAAANQQVAATKQSNAAAAAADNELVARVKAAKAKPGFQQTAQDKLAIQQGAAKGIREDEKKKKAVRVEFNSKFLGMKI